ncbi:transposase [Nostoc sp. LEGE 12447]|nr:transposase [Nostoc sp. LEGE 12447]
MAKTSHIYNELLKLLGQSKSWADIRHLHTLIWMIIGLICSGCISLTKWTIYVDSRAKFAQSHQRRFSRWLHNPRINVQRLYSPIIQAALSAWGSKEIVLIEDTSMLWNRYCLIRVSVRYRGRAVPVGWRVIEHKSSSISFDVYELLLRRISRLLPTGTKVRFMADRGFADTKLMNYLEQNLGWHYRIRVKNDLWVLRAGKPPCQLRDYHLNLGNALFLQGVQITKTNPYGPVNLALARDLVSNELWYIVSDEPTSLQTFREYGERFDIEEEFLDEKSNGFQLEKSLIRSPIALSRLCLVMAITTLFLTAQGQEVVKTGQRRLVDCHTFRGNSYLRLGWEWVKGVLHRGWRLFSTLSLSGDVDPNPVIASQKQAQKSLAREFRVRNFSYTS